MELSHEEGRTQVWLHIVRVTISECMVEASDPGQCYWPVLHCGGIAHKCPIFPTPKSHFTAVWGITT